MMRKCVLVITTVLLSIGLSNCNTSENKEPAAKQKKALKRPNRKAPKKMAYHFEKAKVWLKQADSGLTSAQKDIIIAVNRTDKTNIVRMDSILVPADPSGDIEFYMNFPMNVAALENVDKIILFSYPSQTFAAYENGELVYAGPTNMGRKADPTPEGLYYTNWKAEQTTSTFNDEWDLKWNFNVENKEGIGFHQYELPGYPASHSCMRLQEKDAKYLYQWADQWKLDAKDQIISKGTPVIVFGVYPFGSPKPWLQLVSNPAALDIPASQVEQTVAPHLDDILKEQARRTSAAGATAS